MKIILVLSYEEEIKKRKRNVCKIKFVLGIEGLL